MNSILNLIQLSKILLSEMKASSEESLSFERLSIQCVWSEKRLSIFDHQLIKVEAKTSGKDILFIKRIKIKPFGRETLII